MDRLTGVTELLDGPLDDAAALTANLRDLRRINRVTGGAALSVRAVRAALPDGGSILDVGCGGADIPMALIADARRRDVPLAVTATDSRQEVLDAAVVAWPAIDMTAELDLAVADGRRLPYADGTFDIAHTSMVVHHLDRDDAIAFIRELRRVSRLGVVVNDLARSWPNWLGGWLITHSIAASRYTRNDGPLSVRRAWTHREMNELIRRAGLEPKGSFIGFAGHRYAIVAR
jgi:ubiquinone/menaquinone biosynthesis C-methylase UbiE